MNKQECVKARESLEKIPTHMRRIQYWVNDLVEKVMANEETGSMLLLETACQITNAQGEIYKNILDLIYIMTESKNREAALEKKP